MEVRILSPRATEKETTGISYPLTQPEEQIFDNKILKACQAHFLMRKWHPNRKFLDSGSLFLK